MSDTVKSPLIVGFVADLMFTVKITNVARHLGFQLKWVESAAVLGNPDPDAPQESPGEALTGPSGCLFTQLSQWQPALLLFDLTNENIPWREWISSLKASPATRRMPIMCFGPHANVETMNEAKRVGADVVLARSRFTAGMPQLFQQYARLPDSEGLESACRQPLSELAIEGINLHNRGEFFEAHEALENAWNADEGAGRELYRGILQVSIAYLQLQRGNYRGAVKMCLRVRQWLNPLPDICRTVNVKQLRQDVEALHEALIRVGAEGLNELDPSLLQPIVYDQAS